MSSRISRLNLSSLAMAGSRASSRRAICSRWTRSVVRVNRTRQPFSTRAKPRAAARWLLPPPGGPNNSKIGAIVQPRVAGGERHDLGLADHRDDLEVESVEGLAGRQPGFGQMAFEAAAGALGNLMFGQCRQETSGRPAFLVGLGSERGPDLCDSGQPQLGKELLDACGVAGIGRSHAAPTHWTVLSSSLRCRCATSTVM